MQTAVRTLTRDERYVYQGLYRDGAVCRVRVYEAPGEVPVLLITELEENDNTRVTNLAEYLAAELMVKFLRHRLEEEAPAIVIEHVRAVGNRPLPTFDRLVFPSWTPRLLWKGGIKRIGFPEPDWRHLPDHEVEAPIGALPDDGALLS